MEVRGWLGVGIVVQNIFGNFRFDILIHGWRGESQCKVNRCCRSYVVHNDAFFMGHKTGGEWFRPI